MIKQELDISAILVELWQKKWIIIVVTAIFAVSSVFYALSVPNTYKSTATLASAKSDKSSSLASLAGQFSGLANLAGINLGSGSNIFVIMERIKSKDFVNHFIKKHDLVIPLFAATGWDPVTKELSYEGQKSYDMEQKKWIRKVNLPLQPEPSESEIFVKFKKRFSIDMDRKTKIITINWEFLSPQLAHQWLTWYIADFNNYVRDLDMIKVDNNLGYLYKQVEKTDVSQLQSVLFNLIEEQTKKKMLSEVQAEYALTTVDSASLPLKKNAPRRSIIVIAITFIGGFLSSVTILLLFFRRWDKESKALIESEPAQVSAA
ncbi:MAG: hypothetical protein ACI8WB_000945 [Phenylobacterium sp.]|jgi:uncharacterized protein involved in exopolysaccharide biosynthesis